MHALLCSFHVPVICTYDATFDGEAAIDGCFGFDPHKFFPSKRATCLTITPFSGTVFSIRGGMNRMWCLVGVPSGLRSYYAASGEMDLYNHLLGSDSTSCAVAGDTLFDGLLSLVPPSMWWRSRRAVDSTCTVDDVDLICRRIAASGCLGEHNKGQA